MNALVRFAKKIRTSVINFFIRAPEKKNGITIFLTEKHFQMINQLIEKSGCTDFPDLCVRTFACYEMMVDRELQGWTIELVEPNGVNREKFSALKYGQEGDEWKDK